MEWTRYRKVGSTQMRQWVPSDGDLSTPWNDKSIVSVSAEDTPGPGGMIAKSDDNDLDRWYVAAEYFTKNYEPV